MLNISAAEALTAAQGGEWLLDVREPAEWDRGHSPLAHSIPMSQLNDRVAEIPADVRILVVCHAGSRSLRVTEALQGAGYPAVNVTGGMIAWEQAGGALVAVGDATPRVD